MGMDVDVLLLRLRGRYLLGMEVWGRLILRLEDGTFTFAFDISFPFPDFTLPLSFSFSLPDLSVLSVPLTISLPFRNAHEYTWEFTARTSSACKSRLLSEQALARTKRSRTRQRRKSRTRGRSFAATSSLGS